MARQLSLAARPRTLDQLVGQEKTVDRIRGHMKSDRIVKAWLFSGEKGTGKTSISRILALAYQCEHQKVFGNPCKECRERKSEFPIYERNASNVTGIDAMRRLLDDAEYGILGEGKYKVYILDEVHQLSKDAQNALLKGLEDSPDTAVFILCSTRPQDIIETLRSRCVFYELRELGSDDIVVLVTRLLKFIKSDLPADRLSDALDEKSIRSPRLIAQAVEKYAAGALPEEAAQVEGATTVDVKALGRCVIRGDWSGVATYLDKAKGTDLKPVRLSMIAYLKEILLNSHEINDSTLAVSKSLQILCELGTNAEDMVVAAAMTAALYSVCSHFSKYPH